MLIYYAKYIDIYCFDDQQKINKQKNQKPTNQKKKPPKQNKTKQTQTPKKQEKKKLEKQKMPHSQDNPSVRKSGISLELLQLKLAILLLLITASRVQHGWPIQKEFNMSNSTKYL